MKPAYSILLSLGFLLLSACSDKNRQYDASGTFETTEVIVSSEANGKILSFDVREGQMLETGQSAGTIDSIPLYLRKKQLQANIKAVESRRPEIRKQIASIEQQIATQKIEKKRMENLLYAKAANQKQLDDINAQIAFLEKQLEAQKSTLSISSNSISEDVATLEVQIEQLEDQLKKCQIINPVKGTVLVKYAEAGEVTSQGKALYKIADTENMKLRAYLVSSQLTRVKAGQNVKVFADFGETESREYQGTIEWISDKAEFTPKTIQTRDERANLVYAVKIAVKNDGYLKIGMYGNILLSEK
jgi:HlyD family secretion protein